MKYLLAVVVAGGLLAAAALATQPEKTQVERLQDQVQAIADGFGTRTDIDTVKTALGQTKVSSDWSCGDTCRRVYRLAGTGLVPFHADLRQFSTPQTAQAFTGGGTDLRAAAAHRDDAFDAGAAAFEFDIDPTAGREACLSESRWAAAVTKAGWETPRPFTFTLGLQFARTPRSVQVNGFVTRRGSVYMALAPQIEGLRTSRISDADIDQAMKLGDCLRVVIVDAGDFNATGAGFTDAAEAELAYPVAR